MHCGREGSHSSPSAYGFTAVSADVGIYAQNSCKDLHLCVPVPSPSMTLALLLCLDARRFAVA